MAEFSTNPGDRSVTELEREVDRERERVSATIDELQATGIGREPGRSAGEGGGREWRRGEPQSGTVPAGQSAGGSADRGRACLAHGRLGQAARRRMRLGRPGPRLPPLPARSTSRRVDSGASADGNSAEGLWPNPEYPDRDTASSEGGLRERVADIAGRVGEGVSEAVEGLRERASDVSHAAGAGLHQAGDTLREAGGAVRHRAGAARRSAAGTGHDMRHGLDTLIEDQPLVAGAIAMALGAAVGGALPRSRVEDRMFGEQSDRAMETVRTLAKEQGAKVQATASAVVDEALNIADEASAELGAKLPSGEEIVDAAESKVREAASRLREASGVETSLGDPPTRAALSVRSKMERARRA